MIKEEPQWDRVPAQVKKVLRPCLEKDPQKRLRHIGDVMAMVDGAHVSALTIGRPRRRAWMILATALAGVLTAAVGRPAISLPHARHPHAPLRGIRAPLTR